MILLTERQAATERLARTFHRAPMRSGGNVDPDRVFGAPGRRR